MSDVKLYLGDCLEVMPILEASSIDAIITDIPYGTTACAWDAVIPFEPMWTQTKRLLRPNGVFITTASQPFASLLVCSNLEQFKYDWVWRKNTGTGFATAKHQPLRYHEGVYVFSEGKTKYNPIPTERFSEASKQVCKKPVRGGGERTSNHIPMGIVKVQYDSETKGPESVLEFKSVANAGGNKLHPTQKPIELYSYLVCTYTNEGDTVLDFCMGSGTTGEACYRARRNFIGIEKDEGYYEIARDRLEKLQMQTSLFVT